tara:strand:+ start:828 stop:1607 length:780 start_codon:yes stop_codon:yes gene_type:complete
MKNKSAFYFFTFLLSLNLLAEEKLDAKKNKWLMAPFKTHRLSLETSVFSQAGTFDSAGAAVGLGGQIKTLFNYRSYFGGLEYSFQALSVGGSSSNSNFPESSHTGTRDTLAAMTGLFLMDGKLRLHGSFFILNKLKLSKVAYDAYVKYTYYDDNNAAKTTYPLAQKSYSEDTTFIGSGYEVGGALNLLKRVALNFSLARYNYAGGMVTTKDVSTYNSSLSKEEYQAGTLTKYNNFPKELNFTTFTVGLSIPFYFETLNN